MEKRLETNKAGVAAVVCLGYRHVWRGDCYRKCIMRTSLCSDVRDGDRTIIEQGRCGRGGMPWLSPMRRVVMTLLLIMRMSD